MNIVLLSGGSGKRLWPLSNEIRSKQFIKIFKTDVEGEYESMVQRVYKQIKKVDPNASVTIATSKAQVSAIHNQLGQDVGISIEPCRRDTFPAIALASAYLHDVMGVRENEPVVVCPVDPYVNEDYFEAVKNLSDRAANSDANLVLMGIEPTYPSEKYGYIIPKSKDDISDVSEFKEKPTEEVAKEYISKGALWNGGVFAYKLGYVLNKSHELINYTDYDHLFNIYETLPKISFDYEVVEKEPKIEVMRFNGQWKDLGTWNTLAEAMEDNVIGKGTIGGDSENVHIINETDMEILAMGLKDVIISASPDGIIISDKEQSSYIKPYVDRIAEPVKYAEKSWGSFKVIDVDKESMTIKVTLNPGHSMNYHSHQHRDEVWVVVEGQGKTIIDGMEQSVGIGDVITMQSGCRHTVIAETELKLIEVQLGREIDVNDKQKFKLE
ncbi:MAG: cupin domain-containing protein [Lachnospiraceae bacterium]|nr:cupin domain-containing protein [Lachnospiraceae bacterium]